jgi:aryl-alcohol dehydrogenase-like predicted oxidoreductase
VSIEPLFGRIGLGTVQFGMPYGVTNTAGTVPEAEVAAILEAAAAEGVTVLDTAALYGDSEAVLGRVLAGIGHPFRVVTKTAKHLDVGSGREAADRLKATFSRSLERLGLDRVDGLIVHDCQELLGPHGEARWQAMADLKASGAVGRIGASVYTGADIDQILDRYAPDLIQAPMNAIDHRLEEGGQLQRLSERGVRLHVRSVFLQGLLLQASDALEPRFAGLIPAIRGLELAASRHTIARSSLLIGAVLRHPVVECALVGVASPSQWQELAAAIRRDAASLARLEYDRAHIDDLRLLDPSRWASL